ncbi:MAG TPA: hypothetical protein VFV64_08230 [Permianibacter sp.]|nr:hypothetical protein [Permianibacter sp.]
MSAATAYAADSAVTSFRRVMFDELTGIAVPVGYPDNRAESYSVWDAIWAAAPRSDERDTYGQEFRFVDGASMRQQQGEFPDAFLLVDWTNPKRRPELVKATVQQPALFEWGCDGSKIPVLRLGLTEPVAWQPNEWSAMAIDVPSAWPLPKAEWLIRTDLPSEILAVAKKHDEHDPTNDSTTRAPLPVLKLSWPDQARVVWIVELDTFRYPDWMMFETTIAGELRHFPIGRFWQDSC